MTYEDMPTSPPQAMFGTSPDNMQPVTGIAHYYEPPAGVNHSAYVLNFVKFPNLAERQVYYYKVKSGSAACAWSEVYNFRAGYSVNNCGFVL